MTAKAPVLGFHHPGIVVPDLERAVAFYTEVLGYEAYSESAFTAEDGGFNQIVGLDGAAAKFCMLSGTNTYIELFEYESSTPKSIPESIACEEGLRHLAFVVDDVNAVVKKCEKNGGARINDPVSISGGATAAYCRDPFGNLLEFITPGGRFPPLKDS